MSKEHTEARGSVVQNPISMPAAAAREGAGVSSVELPQVVLRSGESTSLSEEIVRPARRAANSDANGDVVCNRFRRRAAAAVVVMACAAWTALAEPSDEPSGTAQQKSRAHNGTRNETFAVALLREHCEHVPAGVVTSAFACPSTMIIAACLALVIAELYKVYEDAQAPSKNSVADEANQTTAVMTVRISTATMPSKTAKSAVFVVAAAAGGNETARRARRKKRL